MNSPLSRLSSSLNVVMPFRFNASYRWLVNFLRVSEPLKLIKTWYSYLHPGTIEEEEGKHEDEEEEEAFSVPIELLLKKNYSTSFKELTHERLGKKKAEHWTWMECYCLLVTDRAALVHLYIVWLQSRAWRILILRLTDQSKFLFEIEAHRSELSLQLTWVVCEGVDLGW